MQISQIIPYERNPRLNENAVDAVKKSILQCDYIAPIVVDEDGVILAGHTRYLALHQLGYEAIDVVVKEGLSDEQKRKYRLLDNKTAELADWDLPLLEEELDGLDFEDLELDWGTHEEEEYDFSDLEEQNREYAGEELAYIRIAVPSKYESQVKAWLENGEAKTAVGMGYGVMKRCGLH